MSVGEHSLGVIFARLNRESCDVLKGYLWNEPENWPYFEEIRTLLPRAPNLPSQRWRSSIRKTVKPNADRYGVHFGPNALLGCIFFSSFRL